jgi:hypothetical protein
VAVERRWWRWNVAGGGGTSLVAVERRWWRWNVAGGGGTSLVAVERRWWQWDVTGAVERHWGYMRLLGRFEAAAYRPRCLRATGGLYRRCEVLTSHRRSLEEVRGCYNQGRSLRAGYGWYKRRGVSASGGGCWGK